MYDLVSYGVAPYMGAWIETPASTIAHLGFTPVAPYMGAWIETIQPDWKSISPLVAPYMGAWIENILSFCPFCC